MFKWPSPYIDSSYVQRSHINLKCFLQSGKIQKQYLTELKTAPEKTNPSASPTSGLCGQIQSRTTHKSSPAQASQKPIFLCEVFQKPDCLFVNKMWWRVTIMNSCSRIHSNFTSHLTTDFLFQILFLPKLQ